MTAFPAIKAALICPIKIASGKFQGEIAARHDRSGAAYCFLRSGQPVFAGRRSFGLHSRSSGEINSFADLGKGIENGLFPSLCKEANLRYGFLVSLLLLASNPRVLRQESRPFGKAAGGLLHGGFDLPGLWWLPCDVCSISGIFYGFVDRVS